MISGVYFKIIWRLWGPGQPGHTWDPGGTAAMAGSTEFQEKQWLTPPRQGQWLKGST